MLGSVRRSVREAWFGLGLAGGVVAAAWTAGVAGTASGVYASVGSKAAEFGVGHPQCLMWTNWRHLCSRAGQGGATTCVSDPLHVASPSKAFCVRGSNIKDSRNERESRDRFCLRFERVASAEGSGTAHGGLRCMEYRSERPFSGQTIEQMNTPLCRIWGSGEPTGDICTNDPGDGSRLPSCSSRQIMAIRRDYPWSCTAWRESKPCRKPVGGTTPVDRAITGPYVFGPMPLRASPVWGTYCESYEGGK